MATITSANAVFLLSITALYPSPQQLQGFSADDIFTTDVFTSAEVLMGLDGFLSGGYTFTPARQGISLQADSPSNAVFDTWFQQQTQITDVYVAQGTIILPSIRRKYTMTNGFLTSYPPIADAVKTLRPRKYGITWQSCTGQNI